jgi:hypothetical protein
VDLVQVLRAEGIRDRRVLAAFGKIPRARFVPPGAVEEAYLDAPVRIPHGQVTTQPSLIAAMVAALGADRQQVVVAAAAHGSRGRWSSRSPPWPTCPALEARAPDICAALTVLGRLVGPEEDMATVVDRLQLFDTDLQAALLGGAHLQGASLHDADLRGAFLVYAQLSDVSLHGTDLRGADLRSTQLEGARHLDHANLRGAVVDTKTRWPAAFDAAAAGVRFGADYN